MRLADIGMDKYDFHARLKPALLAILPVSLLVMCFAPGGVVGWAGALAIVVQAGGAFILAQFTGDLGKKMEPKLFRQFGGRPTESLLSHAGATNKVVLAQRHKKFSKLLTGVKAPTAQAEAADPDKAREIYCAVCDKLRAHVRGKEEFAAIHRENIHYGFRRNSFALRWVGVTLTGVGLIILGCVLYGHVSSHERIPPIEPIVLVILAALFLWWVVIVRAEWVGRASLLYAERLLEALDTL
jgi:hypothetical protein